jgi:rare lipoprotein A (peptidoglycan hydrolase)
MTFMIAQAAAAIRGPRALCLPRSGFRLAPSLRWPAIVLAVRKYRQRLSSITLAAGTLAVAATFAFVIYSEVKQDSPAIDAVRNETILYRHHEASHKQTARLEASDEQEDEQELARSNYPRAVQLIRFAKPNPWRNIATRADAISTGKLTPINARTEDFRYRGEGMASWYGPDFHGRRTANGERYDMNGISAAHRSMPLPSYARVTNLANGRSIIVRVNNRGPFVHNRIVDLSVGTAKALDFYKKGTARVRVEFVGRAPVDGSDDQMLLATLRAGTPAPVPLNVMVASAKPFQESDGKALQSSTEH